MSAALSAAAYKPGDLSRLLTPGAGAPVVVSATAAADPSFFGYLRPTKGRKPSRKAAKGGGKFSKETLAKKAKAKKEVKKGEKNRHIQEVADAAAKKLAKKEAYLAKKAAGTAASAAPADGDADADDSGMDESDGDEGDDIDEAAIEDFMADIDAEDEGAEESSDDDEAELDPLAKAKKERLAKKEKRLAEDKEAETPRPSKKDIKKQRLTNLANDPRLSRTIFVGNVPSTLKPAKLSSFIEKHLGVDSSTKQSIIESVRYRSVAISDPKLPKKVAIQKGLLHEARDSLNAYVVFTEEAPWVTRAVQELNGKEIEIDEKSWRLRVDTVTPLNSDGGAAGKPVRDNSLTLFVGNLPFNINENDLYSHFAGCGQIAAVRVVRDRESNMGKGIAFLTFADAQSMRNGLAFNHTKFVNRELRIMKAVENKKLHHTDGGKSSSSKKGAAASGPASASATSASGKKGLTGAAGRKEGYGGVHKIKEVNQAGVLKKPRHTPRDGSAPTVQPKPAVSNVAASSAASAASSSVTAAAAAESAKRPISASRISGAKRSFEGEHADPSAEIKKQKVEDVKQREKKQQKRDNKKLAPAGAGSKKKD